MGEGSLGNSADKLRHAARSAAYSVELVLLNGHQISGVGAYLHCYRNVHKKFVLSRKLSLKQAK